MIAFSYALDVLFSAIFLLALRSKATNVMNFHYEIISYGVVYNPLVVNAAAYSVLISEALLVLCFATGLLMEWGIALAILLLGFFTILYWRKRKLTGAKGCHCFGHHSWLNRMPIYRNGTLVILLAVRLLLPHRPPGGWIMMLVAAVILSYGLQGKSAFSRTRVSSLEIAEAVRRKTGKIYPYIAVLSHQTDLTVGMDRLLSAVSTDTKQHHDMAVILDAPDWFIAMKRQKWNHALLLSAESILPHGSDYPFILVCKRSHSGRIVYSMVTEIDGFVEWWRTKNEKSSEMAQSHSNNF
ncbi:hypothetical protein NDS46_12480 [Paenibacillus thiaminolyticus]|uniref:MauE/DoxX family redox-associated membrane protein n=1 Tax=Paenibacillus thiaminolyticus TaxID=49283 RepID=UPI00232D2AB4|nr:MauE/DoxX family redox-associated membrane protein [Paenibacillus thiaminolyticus]WCF10601.1 hypothetical protein NDS46_12480 [Paenibacillus thiaminolyticus]